MAQWILKSNGYVVPRRTIRTLHVDELYSPEDQKKRNIFGALIERRWVTSVNPPPVSTTSNGDIWEEHKDKDESARIISDIEDMVDAKGRQLNQHPAYKNLINVEAQLQHDTEIRYIKVKERALNPDSQNTVRYNKNTMLNSIIYEVKFEDGHVK